MQTIRRATNQDRNEVSEVHLCAFPEGERDIVSKLAVNLLFETTTPETISLVAEAEGEVVAHIAFSPVTSDSNENFQAYILAPLGVKPEYQNRRIGTKLIKSGMQQLSVTGVHVLFVYGDPGFYGRFGFREDVADRYTPPCRLQYPFGWQAAILNEYNPDRSSIKIACVTSLNAPELW